MEFFAPLIEKNIMVKVVVKGLLDERAAGAALVANGHDEKTIQLHLRTIGKAIFALERSNAKCLLEGMKAGTEFNINSVEQIPLAYSETLKDWKLLTSKLIHVSESDDVVTSKLLIELESGEQIEAVVLRHSKRTTLCVSSQVGCKMGCTFCATGTLGQRANLTSGEILEQLIHANRFLSQTSDPRQVTNVVFMGMGEPLNNYQAVIDACKALTDTSKFGLGPSRVTVSTVGVVNRMRSLHVDAPGVSLALSLHAPNQELRQKIIPTAGAYPLEKLMSALTEHLDAIEKSRLTYVMIEYILLSGVNDMPEIAVELAHLLEPFKQRVKLNLIPYNPIFNPEGLAKTFVAPKEEDIQRFWNIMQNDHKYFCTVRLEMGQDANAACGQLACISKDAKALGVDIEDLYRKRKKPLKSSFTPHTGTIVKKPLYKTNSYKIQALLQKYLPYIMAFFAFVAASYGWTQ